jgi:hypothetical protein
VSYDAGGGLFIRANSYYFNVINCSSSCTVDITVGNLGVIKAGGLIASRRSYNGNIRFCRSSGMIYHQCGGIAGAECRSLVIEDCWTTGD